MQNKRTLTQTLAILGTLLVWIPLLAPLLFSALFFLQTNLLRFDYLMPAEMSLFALLGGGLLLWAALRARRRRGWIGWGLGVALAMLVGGQALAQVTGLASGEIEPAGVWWTLVLASLGVYALAVLVMGVGGVLLLRDLFKFSSSSNP